MSAAGKFENAFDYVVSKISCWRDRTAMICPITGKSITYQEVIQIAASVSNRLQRAGVQPGHVVGICAENRLEYPGVILGIWRAGAIAHLLSIAMKSRELDQQISLAKSVAIYAPTMNEDQREVFESLPGIKIFQWSLEELLADESPIDLRNGSTGSMDINKICLLLSSSGTTGLPKLVMTKHSSVIAGIENLSDLLILDNGPIMGLLPFYHAYGLGVMLMALCRGSAIVVLARFMADRFAGIFATYKITHFHTVSTFIAKLIDGSTDLKKLKSLRYVFTSGCKADPKLQAGVINSLNDVQIYHMFGMTETLHVVTYERVNLSRPASIGRVIPFTKAKIMGPHGETLESNSEGELCLSGPTIMAGYYRNKEATEEVLTEDGWLRTGDLAKMDNDGYIYIIDRIKMLIKFNGLQVSPTEIEHVISDLKGVAEVAVMGIPDEMYGEIPRAYVVKKDDSVTEKDIMDIVERELSYYKWLRGGVKFVESIPKTPLEKVIRRHLVSLL